MALSIYLHYPFCNHICSYCDYSKQLFNNELEKKYFEALNNEIKLTAEKFDLSDSEVSTIYIGGGTPSTATDKLLQGTINQLRNNFSISKNVEFSIECNPEDIDADKMEALAELGVNRVVIGVQTFDARYLKLLGRKHSIDDVHRAVYYANLFNIENIALDILFGLPSQTAKKAASDIEELLALEPKHISYYELTAEKETSFGEDVQNNKIASPETDLMYAIYRGAVDRLSEAGYSRYEISSFAKDNLEGRHNMNYWQSGNYLGLGLAAHSFIRMQRWFNPQDLNTYINKLSNNQLAHEHDQSDSKVLSIDAFVMAIRTVKGINRRDFKAKFNIPIKELFDRKQYDIFIESGHLIPDKGRLRLSDDGLNQADEIISRLLK